MNHARRDTWEDRHRDATPGDPEPSVIEMLPLLPRGRALDIAAGSGRNSIALARAGLHVLAVDFSRIGMRALAEIAHRDHLSISTIVADLEESFPFRPNSFDVILNVSYLDRTLVPSLRPALRPGGFLLFDTFLVDEAGGHGHLRDTHFALGHYELRSLLEGLELIRYREGLVDYPNRKRMWRATALARRES
ncbi:MAG TPA: class I SAM-dependent methyltransferase [Candidatus Binataceae bacterium]|jgi:SAM-dependent methyltransferase|nr:class I SAM-dependent methyltransferase [Candidatus Binataceae bacterium]